MAHDRNASDCRFAYVVYPESKHDEALCRGFGSRRDEDSWIVFLTCRQARTMCEMLDGIFVGLLEGAEE